MEEALNFIKSKKLVCIASYDNEVWVSNVYYGIGKNNFLYFVSGEGATHSKQISLNKNIAFSISWFNEKNHKDRKAIQGKGICRVAKNEEEILEGIRLHNKNFPEFREKITKDYINSKSNTAKIYVIEMKYLKFWNDELFKEKETEEYSLD